MQKTMERHIVNAMESAYIMINCELGAEGDIVEQLKSIPAIREVRAVFGNYDILAKIHASSIESLRDIITFQIRKIPKIYSTTTIMCSKIHM